MKELIYIGTEESDLKGVKYKVSTFIDVFNYEILRGTNLANIDKLSVGSKVVCDLDVKYKTKQNKFVFYVTKVNA